MIYRFSIKGSAEEAYAVTFERSGTSLRAACTCPAGSNGTHCKHRLNLLNGLVEGLTSDNEHDVAALKDLLDGSDLEQALKVLNEAEAELEAAKKQVTAAKKKVAAAMNH